MYTVIADRIAYPATAEGYTVTYRGEVSRFATHAEATAYMRAHKGAVLSYKWTGEAPTRSRW